MYYCSLCGDWHCYKDEVCEKHFMFRASITKVNKINDCSSYYCLRCMRRHVWGDDPVRYEICLDRALFYYYCPICQHVHRGGKLFEQHLEHKGRVITRYERACQIAVKKIQNHERDELGDECR